MAGDFITGDMLQRLEKLYGKLKPLDNIPPVTAIEPPQRGERRVTVKGEGTTDYLLMAFHGPPAAYRDSAAYAKKRVRKASPSRVPAHEDFFPLVALDSVLCGGGTSNRSSRLSKALVDSGLATDISAGVTPTIDPDLYSFFATAQAGKDINDVERALWDEIEKVKADSVTQAELDKAIKQTRAQFAYSSESVTSQAFWMAYCEIFADYSWFTSYLPSLSAVTVDDVKRVANQYLTRDNVTVGHYRSQGN